MLRLGVKLTGLRWVPGHAERLDGVRKEMAESRKGAAWAVLVRRGRERRPEQLRVAADCSARYTAKKIKEGREELRLVMGNRGKPKGGGAAVYLHRKLKRTAAATASSDELFPQPGGTILLGV